MERSTQPASSSPQRSRSSASTGGRTRPRQAARNLVEEPLRRVARAATLSVRALGAIGGAAAQPRPGSPQQFSGPGVGGRCHTALRCVARCSAAPLGPMSWPSCSRPAAARPPTTGPRRASCWRSAIPAVCASPSVSSSRRVPRGGPGPGPGAAGPAPACRGQRRLAGAAPSRPGWRPRRSAARRSWSGLIGRRPSVRFNRSSIPSRQGSGCCGSTAWARGTTWHSPFGAGAAPAFVSTISTIPSRTQRGVRDRIGRALESCAIHPGENTRRIHCLQ